MFGISTHARIRHSSSTSFYFVVCLVLIIKISLSASLLAEDQEPSNDNEVTAQSDGEQQNESKPKKDKKKQNQRGVFIGAPIPLSSPAIGSGATLIGGYIFPLGKNDKTSPPSVIGGGALFTNNGSRGFAVGSELYFAENRYHVLAGYASLDLNYNFYGTGSAAGNAGRKFGLNQTMNGVFAQGTRRLFGQFFIGPRLLWGTSKLAAQHFGEQHPELPPLGVGFNLRALGIKIERDTAANRFYPVDGTSTQFSADFFSGDLGSTFTYQTYNLTFNAYQSLTKNQVLGYNTYICATGGQVPFFGECIFGIKNELRGYPAGRYIDRDLIAMQVEYRLSLPKRFGVVAFAGVGEVGPRFGEFNRHDLLPSVGFGPRFQLSKKYHVNLRVDFAQGKNDRTFSMGLGESF
jgi:hypothetical protein